MSDKKIKNVPTTIQSKKSEIPPQAKATPNERSRALKPLKPTVAKPTNQKRTVSVKHPLAIGGTILGAGILVGIAAHRALAHQPTVGEVVKRVVKNQAIKISKKLVRSATSSVDKAAKSALKAL